MNTFYNKARDQLYREHRQRVLNAKSVLTTFTPREPKKERLPMSYEDYLAQIVNSVRPNVFTFTKSPESLSMTQIQYEDLIRERPKASERRVTKKTKTALHIPLRKMRQSHIRLVKDRDIFMADGELHVRSLALNNDRIPPQVIQRYRESAQIRDSELLRKLLRPKIFLEFYAVRSNRDLGHLEIQLYTEACPAVVLEFVRMCTRGERDRLMITHVVDPISLECELALTEADTLAEENFEHNTNAVDHGAGPGILSCPLRYVHGTRNNRVRFSITLRPLGVLNGKRVAFGRAFGDLRLLHKIQRYARSKKGGLQIKVRTCGIEK